VALVWSKNAALALMQGNRVDFCISAIIERVSGFFSPIHMPSLLARICAQSRRYVSLTISTDFRNSLPVVVVLVLQFGSCRADGSFDEEI